MRERKKKLEFVGLRFNEGERLEFLNCSYFLDFAGIFTFEADLDDEGVVIDISDVLKKLGDAPHDWEHISPVFLAELEKAINAQENVTAVEFMKAIPILSDIYGKEKLFQAYITIDTYSFFNILDYGYKTTTRRVHTKEVLLNASQSFENAIDALAEADMKNQYLHYAKLYAYEKVNRVCRTVWVPAKEYCDKLAEECEMLAMRKNYAKAYALAGMLTNIACNIDLAGKATRWYNQSIRMLNAYEVAKEVYGEIYNGMFRLGKNTDENKLLALQCAMKCNALDYRAAYGLAWIYERQCKRRGNNEARIKMIENYENVAKILSQQLETEMPIEQLIFYNTGLSLETIGGNDAIIVLSKDLQVSFEDGDESEDDFQCYYNIYGKDASKYIEATKENLQGRSKLLEYEYY